MAAQAAVRSYAPERGSYDRIQAGFFREPRLFFFRAVPAPHIPLCRIGRYRQVQAESHAPHPPHPGISRAGGPLCRLYQRAAQPDQQ